jgi:hypothetical protein
MFDIDEKNNNDVDVSFRLPWTHSTVGFGLAAGGDANLTRHATRTFAISETFLDLIALDCTDPSFIAPNHAYPIVGSIGAGNIIDAYLDLGKSGATADRGADWRGTTAGPFKDELTFTTDIGGDIHPSITLAPVPGRFRLINASGNFTAGRKDIHTLTIVIPFPTIDDRLGAGVNLDHKWFTSKEYLDAVTLSKKTIAYEFCIQRAKTGASPTTPGVHRPPEDYCSDEARQKTLR